MIRPGAVWPLFKVGLRGWWNDNVPRLGASLAVSVALAAFAGWLNARVPGMAALWEGVNVVLSLGITTVLFALLYKVLPDVRLAWFDVWVGAMITAVLFTVGTTLIGLDLGHSSTASSYGAAGSIVVLLVWVYLSAQIVLLGAELTRAYTTAHLRRPAAEAYATEDPEAVAQNT